MWCPVLYSLVVCSLYPHCTLVVGAAAQQDMSPPRKGSRGAADPVGDSARPGGPHKPRFMPDGGRAGKVTGAELAAELQAKKQKDAKQFAALGQQLTGHGAETVRCKPTPACHTCWMVILLTHDTSSSYSALPQPDSVGAASSFSSCLLAMTPNA